MKFNPTLSQLALVALLVAAVIVSHMVAPLAVGTITSIVSTIVGAVFVDLRKHEPSGESGQVLQLVKPESDDNK